MADQTEEIIYWIVLAICIPGIIGNAMSFTVIWKHRKWFPSSLLILALTAADLGVVLMGMFVSVYVAGGFQCTTPDVFTTCDIAGNVMHVVYFYVYYCSIYSTVLLSVDKYLIITKPLMVMKNNYKVFRRVCLGVMYVYVACLMIHHILGNFSRYPQCDYPYLSPNVNDVMNTVSDAVNYTLVSPVEPLPGCNNTESFRVLSNGTIYTTNPEELIQPVIKYYWEGGKYIPKPPGPPLPGYFQLCSGAPCYKYFGSVTPEGVDFCTDICPVQQLQLDPEFEAIYISLEFIFRFIIPTPILIYCNVKLVTVVRRAHAQREQLTGTRLNPRILNVVKIVVVIIGVFILSHLAALILFSMAAARPPNFRLFISISLLFAVANSSANILIYCYFLPAFRRFWKRLFTCGGAEPSESEMATDKERSSTAPATSISQLSQT